MIDFVVSNSTLDHFDSRDDFIVALRELFSALKPGGLLFITMDNPQNPFYLLLRGVCRWLGKPFLLGYTTSRASLSHHLESVGFRVLEQAGLIHNPRLISTLLFLTLRYALGGHAERPIKLLLAAFQHLEHLPTAKYTSCFVAACARKPL